MYVCVLACLRACVRVCVRVVLLACLRACLRAPMRSFVFGGFPNTLQLVLCDISDVIFLSLFVFVDVVSRNICFELFR